MQTCNGICQRYKAERPSSHQFSKFALGIYHCSICQMDVTINGIKYTKRFLCKCCSNPIRTKPRNDKKSYQESLQKVMEILRNG
jgi:peptide methionine sulfoxide reductase MsrB